MSDRGPSQVHLLRLAAVLGCLLLAVLLLAGIYALAGRSGKTNNDAVVPTIEPSAPEVTAEAEPTAEPTASPVPVELPETADMGEEYLDKCVFLGNSTTYGLLYYGILPKYQVWVPASGTLSLMNYAIETIDYCPYGVEDSSRELSIADCAADRKPEVLIITLGINVIAYFDESQFKEYYTGLVESIQAASPDTKIICHSIYPVIDSMTPDGVNNEKVNAANVWIQDVARDTGTRYLNSHDLLMDETGGLSLDYNNGDDMGIHLDPDGFNVVLQNVRTHAWQ